MRPPGDVDLIMAGNVPELWRRGMLVYFARWCARVGFREQGGPNMGTFVEFAQKAVDGKARGEPWCAAFAVMCIQFVDGLCAEAVEAKSDSWLYPSEHVLTMWRRAPQPANVSVDNGLPRPGDLMLWNHHRGDQPTEKGHIGIVTDFSDGLVHTVEGNTGAGEGVVREGDGVYERVRQLKGEGSMRTLGWQKVWKP